MPETTEVTLDPAALRRLTRLQARAEGANQAAQAAMMAAQQAQQTLQQTLTEECQDVGMTIPMGGQGQVDVDWRTGVVKLRPPLEPQGAPLPPGNGVPAAEPAPAF